MTDLQWLTIMKHVQQTEQIGELLTCAAKMRRTRARPPAAGQGTSARPTGLAGREQDVKRAGVAPAAGRPPHPAPRRRGASR